MPRKARLDFVIDCADPEQLAEFWREALGYRVHFAAPTLAILVPDEGTAPPLVLQQVPEPRAGKNRAHLDIVVEAIDAEVERLEALGATRIPEGAHSLGTTRWVAMQDPESNEFCVCTGVEW